VNILRKTVLKISFMPMNLAFQKILTTPMLGQKEGVKSTEKSMENVAKGLI
jgi:hypothetical protein